jgi:hypothetical protein
MNKRKVVGVIIVLLGLVLTFGSFGSVETYGAVAPLSMALIVVVGLVVIFWDKVKGWLK